MLPPVYGTAGQLATIYRTDGTIVSGNGSGGGEPADPPPIYEWPRRMQVATFGRAGQTGLSLPRTSTSGHTVQVASSGLSFGYINEGAGDTGGAARYAATASINGATPIPLTWGGAADALLPHGGYVESDPLSIATAEGDTIEVTTTVTSEGGTEILTMDGIHWPIRVLGLVDTPTPAVMVLGSSTADGAGDEEVGGIVVRGFNGTGVPWTNMAWGGASSGKPPWNSDSELLRVRITADHAHTHALVQLGDNHASLGANRFFTAQLALWNRLRDHGYAVAQMTLKPQTDSTDGWTTLEGQTPRFPGFTTAVNGWLRDGAPVRNGIPVDPGSDRASRAGDLGHPLHAIVDGGALIEHEDSELFRVDLGPLSTDGIHMTPEGHALMAESITTWAQALTA